ncbi:GAF domain-containing protein, partial [bacterium]|nr:GAF domain-containing protein [bacterium]
MKHYELLQTIHEAVSFSPSLAESLRALLEILTQSGTLHACAVLLADDSRGSLAVAASSGENRQNRDVSLTPGEGIAGRALSSGKPVTVPDLAAEPLYCDRLGLIDPAQKDRFGYMALPLKSGGTVRGVLSAVYPRAGTGNVVSLKRFLMLTAS